MTLLLWEFNQTVRVNGAICFIPRGRQFFYIKKKPTSNIIAINIRLYTPVNFKRFILLFFKLQMPLHQFSLCNFPAVSSKSPLTQEHDNIEGYQYLDFAIFHLIIHLCYYNIITIINDLMTRTDPDFKKSCFHFSFNN